jgi:hypothetical protein
MKIMKTKIENTASKSKKIQQITYFIWVLVISNMFFQESFGLNALITAGISIPLLGYLKKDNLLIGKWWIASFLWLITATGVFITASEISIISYFISFLYFTSITNEVKLSLPLGISQSLFSFSNGLVLFTESLINGLKRKEGKKNKMLITFLMVTIPLLIVTIFLKLYQAADPTFYELTKFINLDWISWQFILFYALISLIMYGFYHFTSAQEILEIENEFKNEVSPAYADKIQNFLGKSNEFKTAVILLVTLNLMLVFYNFLDISYIFSTHEYTEAEKFSEIVHDGINALITSLVLVILLTSYLFRGQLNFFQNKTAKYLALIWLIQNCIMILTTSIKNYEYVSNLGLTHKRIGVYVYLFLALIGILLTVIKIGKNLSFWFLIRNTTIAFSLSLSALLTFNWNRFIASYNIANVPTENLDLAYLKELGPDTFAFILQYHQKTKLVDSDLLIDIKYEMAEEKKQLNIDYYEKSWRSVNWSDYQLKQEIAAYKIKVN